MTEWKYDGYTKVHSADRRRMIEEWIWKCPVCGYTIRKPFGNNNKPKIDCPACILPEPPKEVINEACDV